MRFPFLAGAGVTLAVMLAGVGTATFIRNLTSDIEPSVAFMQPDPWTWSPYDDPVFMAVQQLWNKPSYPIGVDRISVNVPGSYLIYVDGRLVKEVTFEDGSKQDVPKDYFKNQSGEDDPDQYWSPL